MVNDKAYLSLACLLVLHILVGAGSSRKSHQRSPRAAEEPATTPAGQICVFAQVFRACVQRNCKVGNRTLLGSVVLLALARRWSNVSLALIALAVHPQI